MTEPKTVTLPSGAVLTIQAAPFAAAKALLQALLVELKRVKIASTTEVDAIGLFKNLICAGFSSPAIEAALWACFTRCLYNGKRISNGNGGVDDVGTFESVSARQDYFTCCVEVAKENVGPFTKSLFADFGAYTSMIVNIQKS